MKKFMITLMMLFSWFFLKSQTFVDIQARLTGVSESACGWIDYDQDGDPDIFVTGEFYRQNSHRISTKLYKNIRNDRFREVSTPITGVYRGDFDWADYDLDGDPDLFLTGQDAGGRYIARLYKNVNRTTQFVPVAAGIPGMADGSVEWGDFDRDGDADLLLCGQTAKGPVTAIYRNDRRNRFTKIAAPFPGIHFGTARFDDFDQDGDLDVIVSGTTSAGLVLTKLFINNNNRFEQIPLDLTGLKLSDIAWGDYDLDGDDDFVITGETQQGRIQTKLYRNEKNGYFSLVAAPFLNVRSGSVDWGDMDHDGDLDLLLTGETVNGPVSKVYRNDRNGIFTDINAELVQLYMSDGHFGDYDNDGDLDIVISGMSKQYDFLAKVYRNDPVHVDTVKETTTEEDIFNYSVKVPPKPEKIYYYVYASCYEDLDGSGKKKYHVFFSPVKKPKVQYEMERTFNRLIRQNFPQWSDFDQAEIIQNGFSTYQKAVHSRNRMIKEYNAKRFAVHELNW